MNILFINDYYDKAGGAEKHVLSLMEGLKERGHRAAFFALGDKDERKGDIYVRERRLSPRRAIFDRSTFKYLQSIIKDFKPDILHLHNTIFFSLFFHLNLDKLNIPIVKTMHDFRALCPSGWLLLPDYKICNTFQGRACVKNKCLKYYHIKGVELLINILRSNIEKKKIDLFISPSTPLKEALLRGGFKNVHYLPNFISHDLAHHETFAGKDEEKIILYVGRLGREKGVHNLITAAKEIFKSHPETKLVIVGTGREKENLEKESKELNIDENVIFKGYTDDIKELYIKSYLVAIPSIWMENCPLVALEAMASGKAIVASRIGGLTDIVENEKTGLLVTPNNTKELADAIIRLLENPSLTLQMGQAARERSAQYNFDIYLSKLIELYEKTLHEKQIIKE